MNIKPAVYDNLTAQQRLIAAIEALSRGDDSEHEKLNRTCPKKHYMQADYLYSGMLQGLTAMAVAVELDMTGNALSFLLCLYAKRDDQADQFIQEIADGHAAWNETLEAMGVDPEAMEKIAIPMRHPALEFILKEIPDGDEDAVIRRRESLEDFFKKLRNV